MANAAETLFGVESIALPQGGPLYLQLKRWIEDAVHRGAIGPGDAPYPRRRR
jgi:GntR family transcriptional regulator